MISVSDKQTFTLRLGCEWEQARGGYHDLSCTENSVNWQEKNAKSCWTSNSPETDYRRSSTFRLILFSLRPPKISGRLSPRRVAERLWSDTLRVRLEGEEPRFPIEIADFRKLAGNTIPASTPWYLHWSPLDWTRDFHGAARLYLNKDHPEFIERIENHDGPTLQLLLADVMGQICERLVADPDATKIAVEAEPGSLGAQAIKWLDKAWPEKEIEFIRSVLENRPGAFRAAFLELAELG